MGTKYDLSIYKRYKDLKEYIANFSYSITSSKILEFEPIFITRKSRVDLFSVFLINLPEEDRNFYDTYQFRKFFDTYASLAYVNNKGEIKSIIWNEENYDGEYHNAIRACRKIVEKSRIINAFEYDPKDSIVLSNDYIQIGEPCSSTFYITLNIDNVRILMRDKNHTEEWFKNITQI